MTIRHGADVDLAAVERRVTSLGYEVAPLADTVVAQPTTHSHEGHDHAGRSTGSWWRSGKGQLTVATGVALVIAYGFGTLIPAAAPWLFVAAMLIGLVPIARRAAAAALAGTPFSIEMLMTIAAVGAVIIGAAEEAATVVFLFLVGELLEGVAAGRARASIQGLTDLVPEDALWSRGRRDARGAGREPGRRRGDPGAPRRPHSGRRRDRRTAKARSTRRR